MNVKRSLRLVGMIGVAVLMLSLVSCGAKQPGTDSILKARDNFSKLDSATLTIQDKVRNEEGDGEPKTFQFKYTNDGVLTYSLLSTLGGEPYREYHDGSVLHIYIDGEWREYREGDEGYQTYTRDNLYLYANPQTFFHEDKAIVEAKTEATDDGYHMAYRYDVDKLNQAVEEELGRFVEFTTDFELDNNYNIKRFQEVSVVELNEDGERNTYQNDFVIEVSDCNALDSVRDLTKES